VEWAVGHGIETATFHIPTSYPGTELYARTRKAGRIVHSGWGLYDTRHARTIHPLPERSQKAVWVFDTSSIVR
jgi:hypothetical protein